MTDKVNMALDDIIKTEKHKTGRPKLSRGLSARGRGPTLRGSGRRQTDSSGRPAASNRPKPSSPSRRQLPDSRSATGRKDLPLRTGRIEKRSSQPARRHQPRHENFVITVVNERATETSAQRPPASLSHRMETAPFSTRPSMGRYRPPTALPRHRGLAPMRVEPTIRKP